MKGDRRWFIAGAIALLSGCTSATGSDSGENSSNTTKNSNLEDSENFEESRIEHEFNDESQEIGAGVMVTPQHAILRSEMEVYDDDTAARRPESFDPPLWSVEISVEARHDAVELPEPEGYTLLSADETVLADASKTTFAAETGVERHNLRPDEDGWVQFDTTPAPEQRVVSAGAERTRRLVFVADPADVAYLGVESLNPDVGRVLFPIDV